MLVTVLLPKIFNFPFTYLNKKKIKLKAGDLVEVPFGNKKIIGVVWDKINKTSKKLKIKSIERKFEYTLNQNLIKFINWFSAYNLSPKGLVLKMCLGDENNVLKNEKINLKFNKKKKLKFDFSEDQKNAFDKLKRYEKDFSVSVLQGVTGSGKTIIYFKLIESFIKKKKQVIVLLPEIFLTEQFKERFCDFFGFEPPIWHSKITKKNKRLIWKNIMNGKIQILIGARSSLLLPFKKLGLIIVDEEHDPSYKQEEGIIYNARDMAITRASFENIPIKLITSIPSLETYNNIRIKKYNHIYISKRYNKFPLPKAKIIDLKLKRIGKNYLSDETINEAKKYLDKNNQVLFFLNRRGYAPFLICKNCGFKHFCPDCSIYLTYHKIINKMVCHYCGYSKIKKNFCKTLNKECDFSLYGPGVEKIFEELKAKFPDKKIKIFSSDYLSKKKENKNILRDIRNNKINIIVGTQMISKGFNFPYLNCIIVVDADFSGRGYDLRATEKNIQLYNQLSGRAGRFSQNSTVIYQTITPSDNTLENLIANNSEEFLKNELLLREKNKLPPFSQLIAIIISSSSKENSFKGAQEIKKKLLEIDSLEILGPVDSPIFKIRKKYRTRLLIKSFRDFMAQKMLAKTLNNLKISRKIKLTVDVDPINFA